VSRDAGEFQSLRPHAADPDGAEAGPGRDRASARLDTAVPDLRPRGVGELLDLGFEVLRARFGTFVGVSALIWFPLRAAQPLLGLHRWMGPDAGEPSPSGLILGFVFNTSGSFVVAFLEASVLAILVASHLQGRRTSAREALRRGFSRLLSVGMIALLGGILTSLGFLCLCIPGIALTWLFYLAPAVCVIEDLGIGESLSRSFELAGRRFLPWIPFAGAAFLVGLPFASVTWFADDPNGRAWMIERLPLSASGFDWTMVAVSTLFIGVAGALRGVFVTVWYFDCRARRDGADLEARIARAGASWRAEPAP